MCAADDIAIKRQMNKIHKMTCFQNEWALEDHFLT